MRKKIIQLLINILPSRLKNLLESNAVNQFKKTLKNLNFSYSQEGEDLILNRYFNNKQVGFYVDIGAHHPTRFSNTHFFYSRGWRGINIDAMPDSMIAFSKQRSRDINLEIGISKTENTLTYYMFNEPALNTFSKKEADKKDGLRNYKIVSTKMIKTFPLKSILDEHLPKNTTIDFMSIDVEGLDIEVLESNDWELYRPNLVLIEDLVKLPIYEISTKSTICKFLNEREYTFVAKTFNTLFFKDSRT